MDEGGVELERRQSKPLPSYSLLSLPHFASPHQPERTSFWTPLIPRWKKISITPSWNAKLCQPNQGRPWPKKVVDVSIYLGRPR